MASSEEIAAAKAELARRKSVEAAKAELARRRGPEIIAEPGQLDAPEDQPKSYVDRLMRGMGLTTRAGVEGLAELADIGTGPVRSFLRNLPGGFEPPEDFANPNLTDHKITFPLRDKFQESTSEGVSRLLDDEGLPKPENEYERIGSAGAKLMAGGGGMMAAGKALAKNAGGITQKVGQIMTEAPAAQLAVEAGAGTAGQAAKEAGASPGEQFAASLVGGLSPMAARSALPKIKSALTVMPAEVDATLLRYDLRGVPISVVDNIRQRVAKAYQIGDLDEDKLRRLVDYAKAKATPTRAGVSLDPIEITQQRNLAKAGANSSNKNLQKLAITQDENVQKLISGLDDIAKGTTLDLYKGGEAVIGAISARNNTLKTIQSGLYGEARDTAGRSLPLRRDEFIRRADLNMRKDNVNSFLPEQVRSMLNEISYGQKGSRGETIQVPFNVDSIDALETVLSKSINTARRAGDGNAVQALKAVQKALLDTDIDTKQGAEIAQGSIDAFRKARKFSRKMYNWQEKIPAIQAVVEGVEPDRFMDKFVLGSSEGASVRNVETLMRQLRGDKEATAVVQSQVAAWIKNQATAGNADELGIISQKGLKNALDKIGDRKLDILFGKAGRNQLRVIQRVASYEQAQPSASAVNNSNTATTATGQLLSWMDGLTRVIPGWGAFVSPVIRGRYNATEGANMVTPSLSGAAASRTGVPLAAPASIGAAGFVKEKEVK